MKSHTFKSLCATTLLLFGTVSGQDQTTVTFFGVIPSDQASLLTASRTSTTRPSNGFPEPTESADITITPVGTADSGSETTYSFREAVSFNLNPPSGDAQAWTVEGTLVESASGYRAVESQVFNPTSSGTVTVGVISGNCTFNEDGSGVCFQTEAGNPSDTSTLTGAVVPLMTTAFDINDNHGVGLGYRGIEEVWLSVSIVMMLLVF
ncbi:hypothetical protein K435DRAFT_971926 [Dendrothele bispora CBS 962.96]|uniref:Uncharacterized protein n=1 Tax=Dendrothele bispora (strain CBS 962.96) TaxID=1314807 RepID=A0A4S8L285_DENBC|nr:hypothetical protein K435DRAFT_971926 [Dendrothele bispora CBS 962.96]